MHAVHDVDMQQNLLLCRSVMLMSKQQGMSSKSWMASAPVHNLHVCLLAHDMQQAAHESADLLLIRHTSPLLAQRLQLQML